MKNKIVNYFLLLIGTSTAGMESAYSQGCCSSGAPLLGSMELATTQTGLWQAAVSYRFNTLDDLYWGNAPVNENFRQRKTGSVTAEINYGLGKNFTANTLLTFVQQERTIEPVFTGGAKDYISVRGMSDLILMLKYSLITLNLATQREVSICIGTKLPTGSNQVMHNSIPVSYDLQPGTGATDAIFWGYLFQGFQPKRFQINGIFSYRFTGTNKQKYRFDRCFVSISRVLRQQFHRPRRFEFTGWRMAHSCQPNSGWRAGERWYSGADKSIHDLSVTSFLFAKR